MPPLTKNKKRGKTGCLTTHLTLTIKIRNEKDLRTHTETKIRAILAQPSLFKQLKHLKRSKQQK